ncbi:hypothetical protein [Gellertiella hungarica]|uniref:Uncharacterized protein n=1 Tax=Gellertiella hungarica TaxID=1572859 RepID=A0A7W6J913_9HYPH|nr:hypothetical protein [Gellertiella hungarica]MBB4066171.1 hypothetical protein [Gellertiella hungarica]
MKILRLSAPPDLALLERMISPTASTRNTRPDEPPISFANRVE